MGMAASQARLLSITSRLSDNELRSQLINNQKIRLATESSKASERYVAALNDTKMMYSAYDVKGNPLNKELTFANLTAYSSYNNQYGLRNLSGQILVSEEDAFNFENSNVSTDADKPVYDLEEFLKSYNLEKGTTFFDNISTETIDACLGMDTAAGNSSKLTGEDLKAMFLGGEDTQKVTHEGYDNILSGTEYNSKFEPLFSEYSSAYEAYNKAVEKYVNSSSFQNDSGLGNIQNQINNIGDLSGARNVVSNWVNCINTYFKPKAVQGDTYFDDFIADLQAESDDFDRVDYTIDSATGNLIIDGMIQVTPDGTATSLDSNMTVNPILSRPGRVYVTGGGASSIYTYETDSTKWNTDANVRSSDEFSADSAKSILNSYMQNFISALSQHLDMNKVSFDTSTEGQDAQDAKTRFQNAASALCLYMFDKDDTNYYQKLNDLAFIFDNKGDLTNGTGPDGDNFASVLDVLILDAVFNELGDPIVTWIDTTNPNEDATAKAQWYTNLFNRMQIVERTEKDDGTVEEEIKLNYQVLENGLATSAEWLQFALESGLVSMEQVDQSNNWCSTLYTNCSDITETTDTTEATIAEAEYNSTMAKIEAKDKQFDMQLKNIDTEHESLQTEYDSIKSVLDKNIERNFKMYSA